MVIMEENNMTSKDIMTIMSNINSLMLRPDKFRKWDISFEIECELLINLLNYCRNFNVEVPIKFYEDRIVIQILSDPTHTEHIGTQFTEIIIPKIYVFEYKPGELKEHIDREGDREGGSSSGEKYKSVTLFTKYMMYSLKKYGGKTEYGGKGVLVAIKIDTLELGMAQFEIQNFKFWAAITDTPLIVDFKTANRLPGKLDKWRSNPDFPSAKVVIEPFTYLRMCKAIGDRRDIDKRIFISLSKENGLTVTSGDELSGRIFHVISPDQFINKAVEEIDALTQIRERYEDLVGFNNPNYKAPPKIDSNVDQLLELHVTTPQYAYVSAEHINPLKDLKSYNPIIMEILSDEALYFETKPYGEIIVRMAMKQRQYK